jgi:hypothetical protein
LRRRYLIGAIAGAIAWIALRPLLLLLPTPARFLIAWLVFTAGPGLAASRKLTADADALHRFVLALGVGTAALPILVELAGRTGHLAAFPFLATALGGIGLARPLRAMAAPRASRRDLVACAAIVGLAVATGSIAFAHRLSETAAGVQVFGDYDSFDLSHYAAWASDATHTIPPKASFYSGHNLNAAYFPQLVLAMAHRFADVPLLDMYFRYAWPTFLALGGLCGFVLVRLLAPTGAALLAVVLVIVGGDFSYLAARFLPHQTIQWDYVLWPTNFLSPTMEVLHFNTWGPTLPVFFTALYCHVRSLQTRRAGWLIAAALVTAVLFQFKPFAYIVLIAALGGAVVLSGDGWASRMRLAATIVLTGVATLPVAYNVLTLPAEDQRSRLLLGFFALPQRMLIKLDLTEAFDAFAHRVAPIAALQRPIFLSSATFLFLLVGVGLRWLGGPGVWRALRGRPVIKGAGPHDVASWKLLAWVVVAGIVIPFVLITDPYVDTLQFYETGLYVAWIFAAVALASYGSLRPVARLVVIVIALAAVLPSSAHYLDRKWHDHERPAVGDLSVNEMAVARYLRAQDPEKTVILHDNPTAPSLIAIVSERRVVLGWGRAYYAVGSEGRVRDIDRFFRSAGGSPEIAMRTLRQYDVTHVLVRPDRDRVHPDVLARLTPVVTFPDVVLYSVPSGSGEARTRRGADGEAQEDERWPSSTREGFLHERSGEAEKAAPRLTRSRAWASASIWSTHASF